MSLVTKQLQQEVKTNNVDDEIVNDEIVDDEMVDKNMNPSIFYNIQNNKIESVNIDNKLNIKNENENENEKEYLNNNNNSSNNNNNNNSLETTTTITTTTSTITTTTTTIKTKTNENINSDVTMDDDEDAEKTVEKMDEKSLKTHTLPMTDVKVNYLLLANRKRRTRDSSRFGPPKKRARKRWGAKITHNNNTSHINKIDHTKIFMLKNRLKEINTKLLNPSAWINVEERSPSPEPIYDNKGVRTNTREQRYREKLISEKNDTITSLLELDKAFVAPSDYKAPKLTKIIYMPTEEFPDYNFFGLIVGPRGNTQKKMQTETGCKIAVRGVGAMNRYTTPGIHDEEPLHVHITAPDDESMNKAVAMIEKLIKEVKEGGGEMKQKQLRELALVNGTFAQYMQNKCRICNKVGHPIYKCPEREGEKWLPAQVQCKICGEVTHVSEDCKHFNKKIPLKDQIGKFSRQLSVDDEYAQFMNELLGDGPMSNGDIKGAITMGTMNNNNLKTLDRDNIPNIEDKNATYNNVPPPTQTNLINNIGKNPYQNNNPQTMTNLQLPMPRNSIPMSMINPMIPPTMSMNNIITPMTPYPTMNPMIPHMMAPMNGMMFPPPPLPINGMIAPYPQMNPMNNINNVQMPIVNNTFPPSMYNNNNNKVEAPPAPPAPPPPPGEPPIRKTSN